MSEELIQKVAVLETENKQFKEDISDIKAKLDSLLELKSKGMGAFWFASILIGTAFGVFVNWIKG